MECISSAILSKKAVLQQDYFLCKKRKLGKSVSVVLLKLSKEEFKVFKVNYEIVG